MAPRGRAREKLGGVISGVGNIAQKRCPFYPATANNHLKPMPSEPPPLPAPSSPPPVPPSPPPPGIEKDARGKPLTWPWLLALCFAGGPTLLLVIVSTKLKLPSGLDDPEAIGRMVGGVIGGWGVVPLVVCAIFSLFKSYRKSPRKLAVIAMIVWFLISLGSLGTIAKTVEKRAAEKRALARAAQNLVGRERELLRQMAQVSDPYEAARLRQEAQELLLSSAKEMTPKIHAEIAAWARLASPYTDAEKVYFEKTAETAGPEGNLLKAFSKSRDSLAKGRGQIKELTDANDAIMREYDTLRAKIDRFIETKTAPSGLSVKFLGGVRDAFIKCEAALREIRKGDGELYACMDKALMLLDAEWGNWEINAEGVYVWSKDEPLGEFKKIMAEFDEITVRQQKAQTALLESM
jgi:cell division protein FtsB